MTRSSASSASLVRAPALFAVSRKTGCRGTTKTETQPLFPENPFIAANRRMTITMLREVLPVPPGLTP